MHRKMNKIMEIAGQVAQTAEGFYQEGESREVVFENNRLKSATSGQFEGAGMRVIKDGRIGFSATTDLRDPSALVKRATESAAFGERAAFDMPDQNPDCESFPAYDPAVDAVSLQDMVDMGREAMERCREVNDDYLFSATISTGSDLRNIVNLSGLDAGYRQSEMSATVEIQKTDESGMLDVYEFKSWGRPFDSIGDITEAALEKMAIAEHTVVLTGGEMPVVFTPKAADNLISPLLTALSGKLVQKGSSVLAGKMNERVLDESISIWDDPSVPWAPGSGPCDDEGLPTRKFALVEEGRVSSFMLDLQTAGLLDMPPTASGYRSWSSRPSPASSNTVVSGGDVPYEELLGGLERGLVVDQTLGSGQSNTLAGEFSVNVSLGFLIENGEIRGRIKNCMVAGNVYELLNNVEWVGMERQWVSSDYLPAICVRGIRPAVSH
jgi:PmbA protein